MRIPFRLPGALGLPAGTETSYTRTGSAYDYAFGESPFLSAASPERPLRRYTAPWRREQIDLSDEAGESSLAGWWYRAQQSFHSGAGQRYVDVDRSNPANTTRFYDSRNVDVWTPGSVTLLPETTSTATTGVIALVPFVAGDATDCALGLSASTLFTVSAGGVYQHTANPDGNPLLAACTDGVNLYVVTSGVSGAIYRTAAPATGSTTPTWTKLYDHTATRAVVGWVKQRLVAALGAAVYELVGAGPALPSPVYTHPVSSWTWTGITETGSAIYVGGYAGSNGTVTRFTLNSSGVMPTLTSGVVAAQMPAGEQVTGLLGYLGTYLTIGTSRGVRVALATEAGELQYGPLILETSSAVKAFTAQNRFVWAATTAAIQGDSGLYRIDLGNEVDSLRFAYASDLPAASDAGACNAVCHLGVGSRLVFATAINMYRQTGNLASSGWLQSSRVRYNTLEGKHFKVVRLRGPAQSGPLAVSVVDPNGTEVSLYGYGSGDSLGDDLQITRPTGALEFLSLKFTLSRNASTATLGAELHGYQLKALPGVPRQRIYQIPVLIFDFEEDRNGVKTGFEGRASERLQRIEDLERTGDTVLFQDFTARDSRQVVVIEEIQFIQTAAPGPGVGGWGGVATLTVRTVA